MALATKDAIVEIIALPQPRYEAAVNQFLAARSAQFAYIARALVGRNHQHADEAAGIVMTECWEMIREARRDPATLEAIRHFEVMLKLRARRQVRSLVDGAAPGSVAAQRRWRHVQRTRSELSAALGREASEAEVLHAANTQARSARANPAKQGMVITRADLEHPAYRNASLDVDGWEEINVRAEAAAETDFVLHPAEGRALIEEVVAALGEDDARVARLWLFDAMNSPGVPANSTADWIADQLLISRSEVTAAVRRIKATAIELLRQKAITSLAG